MSTPINDGGSAFPSQEIIRVPFDGHNQGVDKQFVHGMSMRDWFAGLAMQTTFAGAGARMVADRDGRYDETNWKEVVAMNAYEMADAMLAERAKISASDKNQNQKP